MGLLNSFQDTIGGRSICLQYDWQRDAFELDLCCQLRGYSLPCIPIDRGTGGISDSFHKILAKHIYGLGKVVSLEANRSGRFQLILATHADRCWSTSRYFIQGAALYFPKMSVEKKNYSIEVRHCLFLCNFPSEVDLLVTSS